MLMVCASLSPFSVHEVPTVISRSADLLVFLARSGSIRPARAREVSGAGKQSDPVSGVSRTVPA